MMTETKATIYKAIIVGLVEIGENAVLDPYKLGTETNPSYMAIVFKGEQRFQLFVNDTLDHVVIEPIGKLRAEIIGPFLADPQCFEKIRDILDANILSQLP